MKRYRQIGALAIAATGSLALLAGTADAHVLSADCSSVSATYFDGTTSRVIVDVAVNGAVEGTVAYEIDGNGQPLAVPYRTLPDAGDLVEVSASSVSSDGFVIERALLFASRACGPARPLLVSPPGLVEPLPRVVVPVVRKPPKPSQKARPTCDTLRARGAGIRWLAKAGCSTRPRGLVRFAPPVAG